MKKTREKHLRLTETEFEDLQKKAQAACLTESAFIRQLIAGYVPVAAPDDRFFAAMEIISEFADKVDEVYVISPYVMYWNEDFYYVVGWSDKHDNISAFRVDRMAEVTPLKDKAVKKPKDFNVSVYAHKIFEMYDGEEVRVKLECRNDLMKYVIDRFGESVETEPSNGETFFCYADVCLSPTFYGWVFGFGGDIRILEPEKATEDIVNMVNAIIRVD